MTKKRFVKMLMSYGYDRNEANAMAADARMGGYTYEDYRCLCFVRSRIAADALADMTAAVGKMVDAIINGIHYLCENIPIIVQRITEAIPQVIEHIERLKSEAEAATE